MNKIYRIIGMFDTATPFYYSGNSVKTLNFGVILDASALWSTLFPLDFLPPQPVQGLQFIGSLSAIYRQSVSVSIGISLVQN